MGSLYQWEAQPQEKGWARSGKRRWGYHRSSWHTSLRSQQGLRSGPCSARPEADGEGLDAGSPSTLLTGAATPGLRLPGSWGGGGWSLYLLWETLGQFHVPPVQEAGAVVVRAQT